MNAENRKGFKEFFKFCAFILFLWFFYWALIAAFAFVHKVLGGRKLDYPFVPSIFTEVIRVQTH